PRHVPQTRAARLLVSAPGTTSDRLRPRLAILARGRVTAPGRGLRSALPGGGRGWPRARLCADRSGAARGVLARVAAPGTIRSRKTTTSLRIGANAGGLACAWRRASRSLCAPRPDHRARRRDCADRLAAGAEGAWRALATRSGDIARNLG